MKSSSRTFRNIVLPMMILAPLLWLMVGCLYVPWFEHRIDSGPNVRALVGQSGSEKTIRPFAVTRQQVVALLGPAPWQSDDGSALGYIARTNKAGWIWPLCFSAEPADAKSYAVRLVFNHDGKLTKVDWEDVQRGYQPMQFVLFGSPEILQALDKQSIDKLNEHGPQLFPSDPQLRRAWFRSHGDQERNEMPSHQ